MENGDTKAFNGGGETSGLSNGLSKTPLYEEEFPAMAPGSSVPFMNTSKIPSYSPSSAPKKVNTSKTSAVNITVNIPFEERRYKADKEQRDKIQRIAARTGVQLHINSSSRDKNLQICIMGKKESAEEAKRLVAKELQVQAKVPLNVPEEYYRFLLGKGGQKLREIEAQSSCNITIPGRSMKNSPVMIEGAKEGIAVARSIILKIVDEQSKLASERIVLPKHLLPFLMGPNNESFSQLKDRFYLVKINVPPVRSPAEEIVITGDKDQVYAVLDHIKNIKHEAEMNHTSLTLDIPTQQHRYIVGLRGQGIMDILAQTGIAVEVPDANGETKVVLRGPKESISKALTLVMQKANSVMQDHVKCPPDYHRLLIGTKGAALAKITDGIPQDKLRIDFPTTEDVEKDIIRIEGDPAEVKKVKLTLSAEIERLKRTVKMESLRIDPRFHRHIIGRGGANIVRLHQQHGVDIRMPSGVASGNDAWIVRIEGPPEGVLAAKKEIETHTVKLENEKEIEVDIDRRFHSQLIGSQGGKVKELRQSFPEVIITFPGAEFRSNRVQIRGPKDHVEVVRQQLEKHVKELHETSFQMEVRIFKKLHREVIGKGGSNIRQIKADTQTQIELPDERSHSDVILITGRKANVQKAAARIEKIQSDQVNIVDIKVSGGNKLVQQAGDRIVKFITDQCSGVQLKFPPKGQSEITIKGPESEAARAKSLITDLLSRKLENQETVKPPQEEFRRFLQIENEHSPLIEWKKKHGSAVLLLFPDTYDRPTDQIYLIGGATRDVLLKAKTDFQQVMSSLESCAEETQYMDIENQWHKHFFMRRKALMEEIQRDYARTRLFFPPRQEGNDSGSKVRVVGPKLCLQGAMKRIREMVDDISSQIQVDVVIDQRHHRALIMRSMDAIRDIQTDCQVSIRFPQRPREDQQQKFAPTEAATEALTADNTDAPEAGAARAPNPCDIVTISGRADDCEAAKERLLDLVPVSEEVPLIAEFHRNLIGQKGETVQQFQFHHNVVVQIPAQNKKNDFVIIKGSKDKVAEAKVELDRLKEGWQAEKDDMEARSFTSTMEVPVKYHRQLIGRITTDSFKNAFEVFVSVPAQSENEDTTVTVKGYKEAVDAAKAELEKFVGKLDTYVTEELYIASPAHSYLIGRKGVNLRKLQTQYQCEINFPGRSADADPNVVQVTGEPQMVDECCDALIARASEFMVDYEERQQQKDLAREAEEARRSVFTIGGPTGQQDKGKSNKRGAGPADSGFVISGAPWQNQSAPQLENAKEFPSIGGNSQASATGGRKMNWAGISAGNE